MTTTATKKRQLFLLQRPSKCKSNATCIKPIAPILYWASVRPSSAVVVVISAIQIFHLGSHSKVMCTLLKVILGTQRLNCNNTGSHAGRLNFTYNVFRVLWQHSLQLIQLELFLLQLIPLDLATCLSFFFDAQQDHCDWFYHYFYESSGSMI